MTFGSLFSGIGGIDLGLERAGMQCRWQVENDPFCNKVLKRRWPTVPRYGDVRTVGAELEGVDCIAGGFPCQDLSQAGKRIGITGDRSGLWFEFARIVGLLGPRIVLIENVPGLLDHRAMPRVIGELARLGYVGCWFSLRASDFGAAHLRKRIFIVAYDPIEFRRRQQVSLRGSTVPPSNSAISAAMADSTGGRCRELRESPCETSEPVADSGNGQFQEPGRGSGRRDGTRSTSPDVSDSGQPGLSDTQQAELSRAFKDHKGRTVAELRRAFAPGPQSSEWPAILSDYPYLAPSLESPLRGVAHGLPDWMDRAMSGRTKRLRALGNAVVPQCAEWIGRRILEIDGLKR